MKPLCRFTGVTLTAALAFAAPIACAQAGSDLLAELLDAPGSAGLGAITTLRASPYVGGGTGRDLLPLYLYEGERLFLRGDRIGLKFNTAPEQRVEVFLRRRLEGHPLDQVPASLEGIALRGTGLDIGLGWRATLPVGSLHAALTQDAGGVSNGREIRLAYHLDWRDGRWRLRPGAGLAWRDARLNNYYYGVAASEATATRPAYAPGSGVDAWFGLFGSYDLSDNWRLLGGASMSRLASKVRASPIVESKPQPALVLGAAYRFGSHQTAWAKDDSPLIVRVFHGRATQDECHLARIITLRCADINSETPTSVTGVYLGKPFVEGFNGWALDFVGYAGVAHHRDRPYQRNGQQLDLFMKAYWHGFPWSHRVKTRVGWGFGVSIANRVPYQERVSLEERGRQTSKVLNYIDPSIEVSLGDLIGKPSMRETYLGVGVSHRSGIFGSSRLLGTVNGGSNYIYTSLETRF
jgi:MipA family protein